MKASACLLASAWILPCVVIACSTDAQKPQRENHPSIDGGSGAAGSGGTLPQGSGGGSGSGGSSGSGGGVATSGGGTSTGGAFSSGGAGGTGGAGRLPPEPDSGIPAPPARTGKACSQDAECPSGLCLLGICDEPGCGPSKGITEICDGLDNDCDGYADNNGACSAACGTGFVANGHTYAYCGRFPYRLAEHACRSVLMHVARLDSRAEIDGLVGHFSGGGEFYASWISGSALLERETWRYLGGDVFWKGGTAPKGAAQNGFPALWLDGQPNDLGLSHTQKCLTLESQSYADADCALERSVLCEQYNLPITGCFDGVRDGDETDTDCGGSCGPCAAIDQICLKNSDCASGLCLENACTDDCTDHIKNGTETDIDCGGVCPRCKPGLACNSDYDCGSRICTGGVCAECVTTDACPKCEGDYACCAYSKVCSCHGVLSKSCF